MPRKRKSRKCRNRKYNKKIVKKISVKNLNDKKAIQKVIIVRHFSTVDKNANYLHNIKSVIKSLTFGVVEQRLETVSKTIMNTLAAYSKPATDYLCSKLRLISPSIRAHQMGQFLFPNLFSRKVQIDNPGEAFVKYETNDANTRSVFEQLWGIYRPLNVADSNERLNKMRNIIITAIKRIPDLEMHLLIKLMLIRHRYHIRSFRKVRLSS